MASASVFQCFKAIFLIITSFTTLQGTNGQLDVQMLCPDNKMLQCDSENNILHIERVQIVSNSRACRQNIQIPDCSETLLDDTVDRIFSSCEDSSRCEISFQSITSIRPNLDFDCPGRRGPPPQSNSRGPRDSSHAIRVEFECHEISNDPASVIDELTIPEDDAIQQKLLADHPLTISSPSYSTMSARSQEVICVFTRTHITTRITRMHFELIELAVDGVLTVVPDKDKTTELSYQGPLTLTKGLISEDLYVTENVTMHFNKCATVDGGEFQMEFTVESDFDVSCTHNFTNCLLPAVTPSGLNPDTTTDAAPPSEKSNTGVIIGGIIGGLLLLVILLVIVIIVLLYIMRKRRKQNLPAQKRENKHPVVARYSSYTDRVSNLYHEIRDSDFYSEIGHINSVFKKRVNYDDRPVPEIPKDRETEPGYDKIGETKEENVDIEIGNGYPTPDAKNVSEETKGTATDENENSRHSYLTLLNENGYDKSKDVPKVTEEYAKLNKKKGNDKNETDEGVDMEPKGVNFGRLDSEVVMEDNTDLYSGGADQSDGSDENKTELPDVFVE